MTFCVEVCCVCSLVPRLTFFLRVCTKKNHRPGYEAIVYVQERVAVAISLIYHTDIAWSGS